MHTPNHTYLSVYLPHVRRCWKRPKGKKKEESKKRIKNIKKKKGVPNIKDLQERDWRDGSVYKVPAIHARRPRFRFQDHIQAGQASTHL